MTIFSSQAAWLQVVAAANPAPATEGVLFFGILLVVVGLASIFRPQLFFHLRIGRKVPHVTPSGLYLGVLRFGGVLTVLLGLVFIFFVV